MHCKAALMMALLLLGSSEVHARSSGDGAPQSSAQQGSDKQASAKATSAKKAKASVEPAPSTPKIQNVVDVIALAPAKNPAIAPPDAKAIVEMMGTPAPFSLVAAGPNLVIIYANKDKLSSKEKELQQNLHEQVVSLAKERQSEEIRVPHAQMLGDLGKAVANLNYNNLKVEVVGTDKVRVSSAQPFDQPALAGFLKDLRHVAWAPKPDAPLARVFYLNAADTAAALNSVAAAKASEAEGAAPPAPAAGKTSAPPPAQTSSTPDSTKEKGAGTNAQTSAAPKSATGSSAPAADASPPAGAASAAQATGDGTQGGREQGGGTPSGQASQQSSQKKEAGGPASVATAVPGIPDMVFFNASGHDALVPEQKRLLAAIDFPRPEVIINAWTFQTSSSDPDTVQEAQAKLRRAVGGFNQVIQKGVYNAWAYLQGEISKPANCQPAPSTNDYFDPDFYDYVVRGYVADSRANAANAGLAESAAILEPKRRTGYGLCSDQAYCLGYTSFLRPLRPSLTDMLFAVFASNNPGCHMKNALARLQGLDQRIQEMGKEAEKIAASDQDRATELGQNARKVKDLGEDVSKSCSDLDKEAVWLTAENSDGQPEVTVFPTFCFKQVVTQAALSNPTFAPVLRASLANFLFHYKMGQQYPHEFSPFDLSESAQELNSQLNPLIEAFNLDVAALLDLISARQQDATKNGWFFFAGHGTRFVNNGIITVRTLSGKPTVVDTTTQNFFDVTSPPSLTDIISSIGQVGSNVPGPLKTNLTANEAAVIIGALSSVKPAEAKIGREFKINITPRSLSGAASAELDVSLSAKDSGDPTLYYSGKASTDVDNLSRVSQHTVETKIRLESIKLFEISSFTAQLQRSRKNFPLVPPFAEIPYVGSFISVPLPGAKEYHRSTAVMSAIVVPTAADLANGLTFSADGVLVASDPAETPNKLCVDANSNPVACALRKAISVTDLGGYPIRAYNKAKVSCLAQRGAFAGGVLACSDLRLDDILPSQ